MKKKNIFLTILCALCIISSCIVTSFYPNVSTATPTKLPETLEQNLTAFILAKKLEQDPKYEYITFEKDTPEDIQKDTHLYLAQKTFLRMIQTSFIRVM